MALVNCKECESQVSTKAKTCPNCGAKAPKESASVASYVFSILLFLVCFGLYQFYQASNKPIPLHGFRVSQACKTAIGLYNGRDPNTMKTIKNRLDEASIEYQRADGRYFVYDCFLAKDKLTWRTRQGIKPDDYAKLSIDPANKEQMTLIWFDGNKEVERKTIQRPDDRT